MGNPKVWTKLQKDHTRPLTLPSEVHSEKEIDPVWDLKKRY